MNWKMKSLIETYLDLCRAQYPDMKTYDTALKFLDHVCTDMVHISDPLERAKLIKTLVAAVKVAREPSYHHNSVLILRSHEDVSHTSDFFHALAPRDYDTNEILRLRADWILDIGEWLDWCWTALDNSAIADALRLIMPRVSTEQFILVGAPQKGLLYLGNEAGNENFWIVEIYKEINSTIIRDHRNLIWAAADGAYQNNHPTELNEAEQKLNDLANAKKYNEDLEALRDLVND